MKYYFHTFVLFITCIYSFNINSAQEEDWLKLTKEIGINKTNHIKEYMYENGFINNIYQLLDVEDININDLDIIKSIISVDNSIYMNQLSQRSYYKLDNWLNDEHSKDLAKIWLDNYFRPQNINDMSYDDFSMLPNVSSIDATAILKQKRRGPINGSFELKNSPGISYYGYKNVLNFIKFEKTPNKSHVRFSSLVKNTPIINAPDEEGANIVFYSPYKPEILYRLSILASDQFQFGYLSNRGGGEASDIKTNKYFISIDKLNLNLIRLDHLILGNFNVAFGQGLVIENTDKFSPRKTGYGFTKRLSGITPDITNSTQNVMRGIGLQFSNSISRLSLFISKHPRDAIMNEPDEFNDCGLDGICPGDENYIEQDSDGTEGNDKWDSGELLIDNNGNGIWDEGENYIDDNGNGIWDNDEYFGDTNDNGIYDDRGSFTSLIVMNPRLSWGAGQNGDTTVFSKLTSAVDEVTWGGNFRLSPFIGTYIGVTFYESLYSSSIVPRISQTLLGGEDPDYSGDTYYLTYATNSADPEIEAMYDNNGESSLWPNARAYRRVVGIDFSSTIKNISFQGEYGVLFEGDMFDKSYNFTDSFKKSPRALVLSGYSQFDNLNLLVLYRNYDLDYDNPYQRSFSNYQRYKTSILEDYYWLNDPVYAFLHTANPQPQAEEGIYVESRYQFHRKLIGTLRWDIWNRKADNAKYYRTVLNLQWQPLFKYRIYLRQKWQARGTYDIFHPSPYYSRETRIRVKVRLSNFNELELLYGRGYTTFSPRPRLTDSPDGGDMVTGDIGTPDNALGLTLNYNFDQNLKIKMGSLYVKGFVWYFGDNDFRIFSNDFGAVHHWISFRTLVNSYLSFNMKVSYTSEVSSTTITEGQTESGYWLHNPWVSNHGYDYRIQINYAF